MSDDDTRDMHYVKAFTLGGDTTPQQRQRNTRLHQRLFNGVPPEERTGETREGIGLHVFQFSVPIADVAIFHDEVSFRLKPGSECLWRLCSYICDHFDSKCDADDEVKRLTAEVFELRRLLSEATGSRQ